MTMEKKTFKQKLLKAIKSPKSVYHYIFYKFVILIRPVITDKFYLKLLFFNKLGQWPDLDNPKTFNEKLQWLKLYDHNPEYTIMADKVKAKEWVAERIGWEHIIPTLGVWEKAEDIDFDLLPDQFVIKCNHNSGLGMYLCKDKSKMNVDLVRKNLAKGLNEDYYLGKLEWPYKNIPRRILAEEFMVDESGFELKDYKIFNFNGKPVLIEVDFDRFSNHKRNFYSPNWEQINLKIQYPSDFTRKIEKPLYLDKMLEFARILSKGLPHLRTDFYVINDKIYFGELTFYHEAGAGRFSSIEWEKKLGDLIVLPQK